MSKVVGFTATMRHVRLASTAVRAATNASFQMPGMFGARSAPAVDHVYGAEIQILCVVLCWERRMRFSVPTRLSLIPLVCAQCLNCTNAKSAHVVYTSPGDQRTGECEWTCEPGYTKSTIDGREQCEEAT